MRGYKALNEDMSTKYGDMIYELNKEYILKGKLIMCKNGYHFCTELIYVFMYYPFNSRVFEIDTLDGEIIESKNKDKYCSSKIKLIREISREEINKYIEDNLDILINDESWIVRLAVAEQKYGLDKLINDPDPGVRAAVARQGYGLDKLVNDESWRARLAVAKQGYGLNKLINDENPAVRTAVAKQGYGLDILINDEDPYVRAEVAKQGYGLDILINDPNPNVRERARNIKQLYENKE